MKKITVIVFVMFISFTTVSGTIHSDRQALLDCHNILRAKLALGQVPGQPSAADITAMDYDTNVEAKAIVWNNQCTVGHDPNNMRLVNRPEYSRFTYIGQNWAGGYGPQKTCDMWWNEYKDFSYEWNRSINGKAIGHYTQMAWADSVLIGCGLNKNCRAYGTHITCNYAPGGNYKDRKPYKRGRPCSQCPDGYNYCMDGALCARKDQCRNKNCRCSAECQNGGTLDRNACSCTCKTGYYGVQCQKKCVDTHNYCSPQYTVDCNSAYWRNLCRARCNNCKNDQPFVTQASAGVLINTGLQAPTLPPKQSTPSRPEPPSSTLTPTKPPRTGCVDFSEEVCSREKYRCYFDPVIRSACGQTCNTCAYALECQDRSPRNCDDAIREHGCENIVNFICRRSCDKNV